MSEIKGLPIGVHMDAREWEETPDLRGDSCIRLTLWTDGEIESVRYFRLSTPQPVAAEAQEGVILPGLEGKWEMRDRHPSVSWEIDLVNLPSDAAVLIRQHLIGGLYDYQFYRRIPDPAPEPVDWDGADWEQCKAYVATRLDIDLISPLDPNWTDAGEIVTAMRKRGYGWFASPTWVEFKLESTERLVSVEVYGGEYSIAILRCAAKALQAEQGDANE